MGEQMQQIREEVCSWVALGKLVGFWQNWEERMVGERQVGKGPLFCLDFSALLNKNLCCRHAWVNGG
jgi:hypothetical protein